ncbi:MAG TPA: hypothetical protein ENJ62_08360, partial [Bryobacterales bacterium]|nr:hypothetical protein [Bryobacterales bacterium]
LEAFIERRENEAVELVLSLRALPPEDRKERIRAFAEASEKQGLQLLSLEQRSRLDQIRIQRAGMETLAEPGMARMLKLTDDQRKQVADLLAQRTRAQAAAGEKDRGRIRAEFERRLRNVLTEQQQALWDSLAGKKGVALAAGAPSQPPVSGTTGPKPSSSANGQEKPSNGAMKVAAAPPAKKPASSGAEQPAPAAPAGQASSGAAMKPAVGPKPGVGPKPAVAAAKPSGEAPKTAPQAPRVEPSSPSDVAAAKKKDPNPDNVKLQFNFHQVPWRDVLAWLADEAGLALQVDEYPEGTFSYRDTREYTPAEAMDLINSVLVSRGYTLLRRDRLLTVVNLDSENPVPDILIQFVPVERLDERGEFELVKTVFQLARLSPQDVEAEIRALLGPGRTMVLMPKSRQIMVTETAGKLRMIRDLLARAENPEATGAGMVELTLQHAGVEDVLEVARPLLGLEEDSLRNDEIQIATDTIGGRLFVTGRPEKVQLLGEIVKRVDRPSTTGSATAQAQPELKTYQIRAADPQTVMAVLQTLLAGMPDLRLGLDETNRKLIALARPSEHRTITETLARLEGEAPRFEIIPLGRLDPQLVLTT